MFLSSTDEGLLDLFEQMLLMDNPDGSEDTCTRCGQYINVDVCWCGDLIQQHGIFCGHSPTPMGCVCGYA